MTKDIASPKRTQAILEKHGFRFKKSLGQNFLTDSNILRNIVAGAEVTKESGVIEIGPGIGALTEQSAKEAGSVLAFEIDQRLLPILKETMAPYPHVSIRSQDVLKADLHAEIDAFFTPGQDLAVIANLPYYVTTPILMKLLEEKLPVRVMVMMMQLEVAERIAAVPGSKAYGSLSIAAQYYAEAETLFRVPKTAFVPQPNVDSAILRMTRREKPPVDVPDEAFFFQFVQEAFTQRRKTIGNNISKAWQHRMTKPEAQALLEAEGVAPSRRAESVSMEEFAALSHVFWNTLTSD
ncbi:16S rRNA (adenine(1518)-N(6)/adenine(1519)-N(6))-dimethyltransferase RsmA [Alkalicoccus urumqiensis]|uniref:Ribosomal RNA small subunit methyltransferase A n=1 Tax=Alkalicoccus urumqiensis TaxID=1548213 RepID=A0A2P6MDN0_ALKUR|nr:16S rRNA (adenine(1518)-N(6)/adenine(1519)-N(6))-dimethyltransferase RsmA [Alkalicoccus urumqiensis]PRO64388.1 16S rRNA (adenine(1518)-N(6)/adenine(1519)-N(6))-dimethyltransferase [Alkalicoccus urumqiensis]